MKKTNLKLLKPVYCGFTILDNSRLLMYDFHYNFIKDKYGNKAKLLFTDTDSLCYEIQTEDVYKDMKANSDLFDFSNFSNEYYDETNKKVIGKFKDECATNPIIEFVGLRSKMYSIKTENGDESKRAKGIRTDKIGHDDYKNVLDTNCTKHFTQMKSIQSDHHEIKTYTINKKGLNAYDDKRYILDNGINTVAYGYK